MSDAHVTNNAAAKDTTIYELQDSDLVGATPGDGDVEMGSASALRSIDQEEEEELNREEPDEEVSTPTPPTPGDPPREAPPAVPPKGGRRVATGSNPTRVGQFTLNERVPRVRIMSPKIIMFGFMDMLGRLYRRNDQQARHTGKPAHKHETHACIQAWEDTDEGYGLESVTPEINYKN